MMKRWLGPLITLLFLLLLYYKFSDLNLREIAHTIKGAHPGWFLSGVGCIILSFVFHALRWQLILIPQGSFSFKEVFTSVVMGIWFNAVLPGRSGDIARCYHLSKKKNLPFLNVLATATIDRLGDLLCFFGLILACFCLVWIQVSTTYIFFAAIAFLILLTGTLLVVFRLRWVVYLINLFPDWKFFNHLKKFFGEISEGFRSLYLSQSLVGYLFFSVCAWIANIFSYWFVIKSSLLPTSLHSFYSGLSVAMMGSASQTVPSGASGLGVINYGVIVALEEYAKVIQLNTTAVQQQLIAASVLVYLAALIPDIVMGAFFYWKERKVFADFNFDFKT